MVAVLAFALIGCTPHANKTPSLRLRSETQQRLNVGESMTLVFSVSGSEQGVTFTSSDTSVVTVDDYGTVTAVGAGQATVTLALQEDADVTAAVDFTVYKTFFMQDSAHRVGTVDFSGEEDGTVYLKEGQAQALVNSPGQSWYFKCHLQNTGYTASDRLGGWGVGSYLVNSSTSVGDVMFWYGLRYESDTTYTPYYGGWRYQTGVTNKETGFGSAMDLKDGIDVTMIRSGVRHYVTMEGGGQTLKFAFDVPLFEGLDTYPAVYGQNQKVTVTNFSASNDAAEVAEILGAFQYAESVTINAIDDRLIQNATYRLTATVLPEITTDKTVTFELTEPMDGVTLTADGTLTVGNVTGSVTVKATSQSRPSVTAQQTYRIIARPASDSALVDTGMMIAGTPGSVSIDETDGTVIKLSGGTNYIPLFARGEKWSVSFTEKHTVENNTKVGIMSATAGYTHYVNLGLLYTMGSARLAEYGEQSAAQEPYPYAPRSSENRNTVTMIKDGATYYFMVNGKLNKRFTAGFDGATIPVLYGDGATAEISNIEVLTDSAAIDALLAQEKFYVGGYVQRTGESYQLAKVSLTGYDMDWPPVNDYMNGLKFRKALTGAYTISFTMSNITPYEDNGKVDSKILVYLRNEPTTSSLQFVIKKNAAGKLVYTFCPNFDDATWKEYPLPDTVDFTKAVTVKIVKTMERVELYLNGVRVFENEEFLFNSGEWGSSTVCTPGIGSFRCGVTVTDPVVTQEDQ